MAGRRATTGIRIVRNGPQRPQEAPEGAGALSQATVAVSGRSRAKYGAKPVTVDGVRFASKREAEWWVKLRLAERAGEIRQLERQVTFTLHANGGRLVGRYVADFTYHERDAERGWRFVVADAKGYPTDMYRWKRRHLKAEYDLEIREL